MAVATSQVAPLVQLDEKELGRGCRRNAHVRHSTSRGSRRLAPIRGIVAFVGITFKNWKRWALWVAAGAAATLAGAMPATAIVTVPLLGKLSVAAGLGALSAYFAGWATRTPGHGPKVPVLTGLPDEVPIEPEPKTKHKVEP